MADLAAERLAVGTARLAYEAALRDLRTAEAHADFQGLQPALDAASAAADSAKSAYDAAVEAYRAAARQAPLFVSDNTDPVLLLPVRVEAIYFDNEGSPELRIRVYPDDVHVDSHEPALTLGERDAGMAYWRAVQAAGDDAAQRHAAWQALVGASGGARAAWIREALTPPGELRFPDVELRAEAWTRAAHSTLLPDHFEFSAYRDGALVWRKQGKPIPDRLAVGIAPHLTEGEPDTPAFDDESRWLITFELAVKRGMALAVPLDDPNERFDLLTVVGVGTQDAATGAERVNSMFAAHAYSRGLAPLPVRTPTNNTPGSRSGWRPRGAPTDPDVVAERRVVYDPDGDQEAARLARALGIDGTTVLASVCDPAGGEEALLRRMQALQAAYYAWSPAFRPARQTPVLEVTAPIAESWYRAVAEHYTRFVRARGPLPPLRIGRQPYGLLPVSSIDLWQADDVDERITLFMRSFLARFVEGVGTALQVGEEGDQDAVLLDLLSREASPRYVRRDEPFEFPVNVTDRKPPPSTVGAIPATSAFAWLHNDWRDHDAPEADFSFSSSWVNPFPDVVPEAVQQIAIEHPLAQILVLFDENLKHMRERHVAPDPVAFNAVFGPLADRLRQLHGAPTVSLFYLQAVSAYHGLGNMFQQGPAPPDEIAEDAERAAPVRNLLAMFVPFEDDASADLPAFERLFRETLEPLSHRIDAWVTSLATARLAESRKDRPSGIRTGAYGWLMDVEPGDSNPTREGYVVTPSLQHATTSAVLRSGWQAHSDRRAFAVDIQSARARRALAMVEGVREGQTVGALLGYQFERALHDARLDHFIEGFRKAYPLAPLVDADAADSGAAQVAIGARNVVDGQALRRDRQRLDGDDALRVAAGADLGEDAPALRRMLGELDETFDAVADLLLAESVHHLVGGNPFRAGLAADAAGRGQDLPREFDVLRTPRGGIGVTHHVGILLPDSLPHGWTDERPLAKLEPRLEAWVRHRLGPASHWNLGAPLADLGWCALDLLIAPAEAVRGALAAAGELDEAALARLMLVCERLRAVLATAAPLTPTHLDPADPAPISGYDLDELHDRVAAWTEAVRSANSDLEAARTIEAAQPILQRLGALGLPVGLAAAGDLDRVRALLSDVDLSGPTAPPEAAEHPREADAWLAGVLATAGRLLHPAIKIAAKLVRDLPPAPQPGVEEDVVAGWLRDMTLVRPRVEALDGAAVAAEVVAGTPAAAYVVAQPIVGDEGARPWIATAPPAEGPRPLCSLVMQRVGAGSGLCGLVVDSWTEVVPRAPGKHGPEEVVGVAFDYDRPGARAPQALLIAVPPDPERGWCIEDLHACLDEALLLSRIRTLDLHDLPELRTVLPIPDGS